MIRSRRSILLLGIASSATAWVNNGIGFRSTEFSSRLFMSANLHGEGSCFMPLKQLDEGSLAPRIVQIAGAFPGLSTEAFMAVQSEEGASPGQWMYDFSDPDGPQMGTVAIEGSNDVIKCEDPVVIMAEHTSLNISLPDQISNTVDVLVLVDRAVKTFAERRFFVTDVGGETKIGAYETKSDVEGEILGQVILVQIPWLSAMGKKKTGFMEEEEYF